MAKVTRKSEAVGVKSAEQAREAFELHRKEIVALPVQVLMPPKIDVPRAVGIALAAAPVIQKYVPEMKKHLPKFDTSLVERLESTALAAWYAHAAAVNDAEEAPVKTLVEEATALRRDLMVQADALAARGLVDADRVAAIRAGRGNADLAQDLVSIQALFAERWDDVKGRTPVTREELDHAADVGTKLMRALGERERPTKLEGVMDDAELRVRAFTLLARNYDQVRRALTYLRWEEDDVQEIAPSLYTGSRGGRRTTQADDGEADVAEPTRGPGPVDGAAPNAAFPNAAAPNAAAPNAAAPNAAAPNAAAPVPPVR